jgi:hypothetical protein
VSHDIANGGTEYDEPEIERVIRALDTAINKWSHAIALPEPVFVELHDTEGGLKYALRENIERARKANTREACRVYHGEILDGAR